jgi:photosystem I P700 chlorophyll a apoprotein A2
VVVFIVAGHMYEQTSVSVIMKEILDAHRPPGGRLGAGHTGCLKQLQILYICNWVLALACLGVATSTAQHMYALTPYAFFI